MKINMWAKLIFCRGFKSDDMRIRDSYRLADEAGLRYEFIPDTESAVTIELLDED